MEKRNLVSAPVTWVYERHWHSETDDEPEVPLTGENGKVTSIEDGLESSARHARDRAIAYAFSHAEPDGHWCGELKGNATVTSEYVFLRQSLGLDMTVDRDALCQWLYLDQNVDGSWGLAPDYPGDVSTSVEAYLALKILVVAPDTACMVRARNFILAMGGVAKVRVFTQFYLATFGLFPWGAVPEMPAELMILPAWAPINIYRFSSWARAIIVPLLLLSHHQPIFALPNGRRIQNDFLDELWCEPATKLVPCSKALVDVFRADLVAFFFAAVDNVLHYFGGLRRWFLRGYARRQTVKWILDHQESSGDWGGGIFPADHFSVLALILEGFSMDDSAVVKGLEAIERFTIKDKGGKRAQPGSGPVWDTILMSIGLIDSGLGKGNDKLNQGIHWIRHHQLFGSEGDWRIYNPRQLSGAFSFADVNAWYPDVDDTAAAIIAFVKRDQQASGSLSVRAATEWILSMQCRDGGWGAFDVNNDKLFLNKIPFSDMDALCDPSSADVTARVLEAFGLLHRTVIHVNLDQDLSVRTENAAERAIKYLASTQETTGAWYGRWGCNYIYGTSNVLCALRYYPKNRPQVQKMVDAAVAWLKKVQNPDGGWGEGLNTYRSPERAGCGVSTPTQTALGVMALLAHLPKTDVSIQKSIAFLVKTQTDNGEGEGEGATWPQRQYTGTGFPGHWYLGYQFYPHYFPMMALGRYLQN